MIKADLITGFLGSGKTTFLKKYAAYLISKGERICILENDFGAVNVDMLLLQELLGENCELEMVAGGCDADCHKRRMKTKLISMGMRGFDRVLIEPSGIFDTDEFFDSLREEPLDQWYEIGSVIAIADAQMQGKMTEEAAYLMGSQLAGAGIVLLSKTEGVCNAQKERAISQLNSVMEQSGCERRFQCGRDLLDKVWDELTEEDYVRIQNSGCRQERPRKLWFDHQDSFQSLYYMYTKMTAGQLTVLAKELLREEKYGNVIRVKGFLKDGDGWLELNAAKGQCELQKAEKGQEILIVIGEGLNQTEIDSSFAPFLNQRQ